MAADRIEAEVVIEAPPEAVWDVVTDPAHVARWFSDEVEIDLRPGGAILLTWRRHGAYPGRVEVVDPPRAFSFRWVSRPGFALAEDTSTLVEMTLEPHGTGTLLRVAESGFGRLAWPEDDRVRHAGQNSAGWAHELEELRGYVRTVTGAA